MRITCSLLLQLLVSIPVLPYGQVGVVTSNRFPLMAWDYVDAPKVKSVSYVSPITGEVKPYPKPFYWLAPGQGVLFQLR